MIPDQRHLFDLADDTVYLNCAYTSPLLKAAAKAGQTALESKSNPWTITPDHFFSNVETVRELFAQLIGCQIDQAAIIPAASYGIALAARNIPVKRGQNIIVLEDQFPSNVYSWQRLAADNGAIIKTVPRPEDSHWTPAVLEAIDDATAIVAVQNCHWTDGTCLDLVKISKKCVSVGAALVVDGSQSLGALPFSVAEIRPDFLVTVAHKWLLGPYSFGYCYVDPKWHDGIPLEENWLNRGGSEDFSRLIDYRDDYQPGARRFDVGEASNFILAPIAAAALRQILTWGVDNIAASLKTKTDLLATQAQKMGLTVAPAQARSPHMIGVTKPGGFSADLPSRLAQERVFVSLRGESIRVSPHLYNRDEEIERFLSILEKAV